ncbi:hypothetical protein AB4Z11_23450, partial [Pseudoduganella sp. RAF53_2]
MFEFLFKRPGDKGADAQADAQPQGPEAAGNGAASPNGAADRRAAQAEFARNLAGNEDAAVELILNSEFADVRLAAAEHVMSQIALEKVQQAMRNTDRRVAKLAQGRLDALRHQQAEQKQAEACIALAQRLLQEEKLAPNQVVDLDRQWQVIAATPEPAAQFAGVRQALAQRLEAQVNLQRGMIDALAALKKLSSAADREAALAELERLATEHEAQLAAPEHSSLPRHLLNDFEQALGAARTALTPRQPVPAPAQAAHGASGAQRSPAAAVAVESAAAAKPGEAAAADVADEPAAARTGAELAGVEATPGPGSAAEHAPDEHPPVTAEGTGGAPAAPRQPREKHKPSVAGRRTCRAAPTARKAQAERG